MANVCEAYLGMYAQNILIEAIHPDIQAHLDSDTPAKWKYKNVASAISKLNRVGQDTGLEDSKPKKGSSRAVYFPKEERKIVVDGHETSSPTAVKIAFEGQLDKHHGEDTLLGEDQNRLEADHFIRDNHSVFSQNHDGSFHTNKRGVLAPVFDSHPEGHHLEMGRVEPYNAKDLANYTKNDDFPKGLTHKHITEALTREHEYAHGTGHRTYTDKENETHDKVMGHPYVEAMVDMMHNSGMHPGDLNPRNMGIYVHPVTKVRHPVIIDYGFSNDIARKYTKARRNAMNKNRGW